MKVEMEHIKLKLANLPKFNPAIPKLQELGEDLQDSHRKIVKVRSDQNTSKIMRLYGLRNSFLKRCLIYVTGEVKGKYGYYDDKGTLREVEYGATPEGGFNPTGSGLDILDVPRTEDPIASTTTIKNGRKVQLVRRKRPLQQTVNNNPNDPRVQLPASRRRQNQPTSATSEVINRRLPIRGPTVSQQPQTNNNQISNFQPQPLTLNTRPQQQQQRPTQPRQPVARPQPRQLQPQPQPQQFAAQPFQV